MQVLGSDTGCEQLDVEVLTLPAGTQPGPLRALRRGDEVMLVLEGTPTLHWRRVDGQEASEPLTPGTFAVMAAGTGVAHSLANPTPATARVLVVRNRLTGEQQFWPDAPPQTSSWTDALTPHPNVHPLPAFVATDRLRLRCWSPFEIDEISQTVDRNRAHLATWMPWAAEGEPTSAEHYREMVATWSRGPIDGGDLVYRVGLPDGTIVGGGGYHARIGPNAWEIGYWVDQDHQGQGYVSEWVAAQTRLAFHLGLDRIEIHHDAKNTRSARVAERVGFQRTDRQDPPDDDAESPPADQVI